MDFNVPSFILDFYKVVDSVQLRWVRKDNPDYEPDLYEEGGWFDPLEGDDLIYDGTINILPFEDVFFGTWNVLENLKEIEKEVTINNNTLSFSEFCNHIYPFDLWNDIQSAAFYVDDKTDEILVLNSFFHSEDYYQSIITDFESYLEMTLHTMGMHDGKYKYYKNYNNEHKKIKTLRSFWTSDKIITWVSVKNNSLIKIYIQYFSIKTNIILILD